MSMYIHIYMCVYHNICVEEGGGIILIVFHPVVLLLLLTRSVL